MMKEETKNVRAMESQTVEKELGQLVQFVAEVKNTGDVETTYIIIAKWREDGTEEWEIAGLKNTRLGPRQSETLVIGPVECTEAMIGKYFDAKFILSSGETILAEKQTHKAWCVKELVTTGALTGLRIK